MSNSHQKISPTDFIFKGSVSKESVPKKTVLKKTASKDFVEGDSLDIASNENSCLIEGGQSSAALAAVVVAVGGIGFMSPGAIAQDALSTEALSQPPTITYDSRTGAVEVDNNAFDFRTGDFENGSNIEIPNTLPDVGAEGVALPSTAGVQAPNSIELTADVEYIESAFNAIATENLTGDFTDVTYDLNPNAIELTTQFDVRYRPGNHAFGEGIQATVFNADGTLQQQQSAFVRGDEIQIAPSGDALPTAGSVTVNYGSEDTVELRVLNLREDNAEGPNESAIYFSRDGEFIVEDLQDGGDRDFNDGDYLQISGGKGEAATLREVVEVTTEEQITETPLMPETRTDESVETDIAATLRTVETSVEEETDWGGVEAPDTASTLLGHASRVVTDNNEQLVYSRYSAEAQTRLGSDGLGLTGQLAPLAQNPNLPPTLLSGNLTFNPTVGNNEAGLTTTLSLTQFLTPTHRLATDVLGNVVSNPDASGPVLLEPAGAFNNRQWVGYVPSTPSETALGEALSSIDGIFELPSDKQVVIAAADPQRVGRGDSAYTDNVGGLLIEKSTGEVSFVPQWNGSSYAQDPIYLEENEAQSVIYALVPQQPGQSLQIGQTYDVTRGNSGYQIAAGGFTIISADQQPQNFLMEAPEIYAVEDTLPDGNAVTSVFNGRQGVYAETFGGEPVATVDVGLAAEADARVGNRLFPVDVVVGTPGQAAYAKTTRAAGFYLGTSLSGGIGNQQDTVRRTVDTVERATDEMRLLRTLSTFSTPLTQVDSVLLETQTTTQTRGTARFDITSEGRLDSVRFVEGNRETVATQISELGRDSNVVRGEEFLIDSDITETIEQMPARLVSADQQTTTETDSYANVSSVQGELAVGGIFNFGNTPWTTAANTLKTELFVRDEVIGRSQSGSQTGWRAEIVFHPFGEVQRSAYAYDAAGNATPLYKTEPVRDADGTPLTETRTKINGETVEIPINRFLQASEGSAEDASLDNRIAQTVGTGRAKGPGLYLRIEDIFSDGDSAVVAGGLQLSF